MAARALGFAYYSCPLPASSFSRVARALRGTDRLPVGLALAVIALMNLGLWAGIAVLIRSTSLL